MNINTENILEVEQIPSVYESNNVDLRFVSKDLVNGLKIVHKDTAYIIGNLALSEGISPHKNINGAPDELDYKVLLKSGLLLGFHKIGNPITLTTGFPFSTFQLYKDQAREMLVGEHILEFDTATFSSGGKKKVVAEVDNAYVMPEAVSCALALRKLGTARGNFFVVSLGYGTFEAILSTEGGLVQRSSVSTFGLRYAVKLLEAELSKTYYLDLKNEHQIDTAFRNSFIFLNRKRVDLSDLKRKVLRQYYEDVVSPALRKAFDDNDFSKSSTMYLAGGGALYDELLDCFQEEFTDILDVKVPEDAAYLAAKGYCFNSLMANGGDKGRAMGLDIGNSTTVICTFKVES
jgi:plasmid segregation protein ParM